MMPNVSPPSLSESAVHFRGGMLDLIMQWLYGVVNVHELAPILLDLFFPEEKKKRGRKSVEVVIKFSETIQNSYFLHMCYIS